MRKLLVVLFLSFYSFVGNAQSQELTIRVDIRFDTVGLNQPFQVSYIVENAQQARFSAPDFYGFKQLGTSQMSQTNYVNGKMTSSITYVYTLQAMSLGEQFILPASVDVNGVSYSSPELRVVVVEETHHPQQPNFDPFSQGSFGFNDDVFNDLYKRQEELMRPYQDFFSNPDSLFNNPNSIFKGFGPNMGTDMMEMFKNFGDAFQFKLPPLEKPKPKEKKYKL